MCGGEAFKVGPGLMAFFVGRASINMAPLNRVTWRNLDMLMISLLADCYDMLRRLTQEFQLHVSSWGLILSVEKRKRCVLHNHNIPLFQFWSMMALITFSVNRLLSTWVVTSSLRETVPSN